MDDEYAEDVLQVLAHGRSTSQHLCQQTGHSKEAVAETLGACSAAGFVIEVDRDLYQITSAGTERVNYPDRPRSGLPAPRLLRTGVPVSVSECIPDVGTGIPDSAGNFPSQAVRSVPLLPNGHSTTTDGARFLSSFERLRLS